MNRRISIILQVAVWTMLFLSPLTFLSRGLTLTWYLMGCVSPLLMMVVFYANYLWLTPRYYVTGKHRYYLLVNFVMVVSLGIALHFWMQYMHSLFDVARPEKHHELTAVETVFFILRDIFNLAVAAVIATAIVLAIGWQRNEDARLEAEAARADAELRNLRSQINPHFLLNTLNNIYALTAISQKRAQDAIQQLSKMLRHMLYDNQESLVSLTDEVQFLENYVNLMRLRLPQTVDVSFDVSGVKADVKIAPLVFISLVENAFKHGVSPTEPSFVHITLSTDIEREGDDGIRNVVICTTSNTNHPKTEADRSGHGIGLQQVQRRLDLAYPHRYEWTRGLSDDATVYNSRILIRI